MGRWDSKYSDRQREALLALADEPLSVRAVVETLERQGYPALQVEPFKIPQASARTIIARLRKRRAGETFSELAGKREDLALEELRRRIISIADRETAKLARAQSSGKLDLEQLRKLAQVLRELRAAKPAKVAGKPPTKGPTVPGDVDDPFMAGLERDAEQADQDNVPPTNGAASGAGDGLAAGAAGEAAQTRRDT